MARRSAPYPGPSSPDTGAPRPMAAGGYGPRHQPDSYADFSPRAVAAELDSVLEQVNQLRLRLRTAITALRRIRDNAETALQAVEDAESRLLDDIENRLAVQSDVLD